MLPKNQCFAIIWVSWELVLLTALISLDLFAYDLFFMLSLLGFTILVEVASPYYVRPKWRSRLSVINLIGILIFCILIVERALQFV